jgi:hypothetical protein
MRWLLLAFLLLAPSLASVAEASPPGSRTVDPEAYRRHSVHGTVSDVAGAPVKGAFITILRSDTGPEKNPVPEEGGYVMHLRAENSGPAPWKLVFGAPGYVDQERTVKSIPDEGVQIDIKLVKVEKKK